MFLPARGRSAFVAAFLLASAARSIAAQAPCPDLDIGGFRPPALGTSSCMAGAEGKAACIKNGYFSALGRDPTAGDMAYWQARPAMTADQYRDTNLQWLASPLGTGEIDLVLNRLGHYVYGRNPNTTERAEWAARLRNREGFLQQVEALRVQLHDTDQGSGERRAVINRGYMTSYGRLPMIAEINATPQCYSHEMVVVANIARMYQPAGAAELTATIRRAWLTRWKKQPTQAQIAAWIAPAGAEWMTYERLKTTVQ